MKYDHFWDILKIDFETQNFESLVWDHQQGLFCELAPGYLYPRIVRKLLGTFSESLNFQNLPIFEIFDLFPIIFETYQKTFFVDFSLQTSFSATFLRQLQPLS